MDVYVVSNCWWRDGATVIGVGVGLTSAQGVADRARHDEASPVAGWAPWKSDETAPSTLHRDALLADGSVHSSLYQEIVLVPLESPPSVEPTWLTDELYLNRLAEISERTPPDVLTDLRTAHDLHLGCNAHSEGQACCLSEFLLRPGPTTEPE